MGCKKLGLSAFVLPALTFGWGGVVLADSDRAYLDELVVTGTRTARSVLETPVRTEVVTRAEIEKSHARNVKEALENVPGLQLREIHGKAGHEVWLQGVSADRVLVLVDGLPVTATTGSAVDVSQLTLLEVERIEVIKGAASAQYGSAAMGGVVNVVTRPVGQGLAGSLRLDGGTWGEQNPSGGYWDVGRYSSRVMAEAGGDRFGARLVGSFDHSDGIDPEPSDWHRPGDEYDRAELASRFDWRPSLANRFVARASVFEESLGSRYSERLPGGTVRKGKEEEVQRWRAEVRGEHDLAADLSGFWAVVHEELEDDTFKYSAISRFDDREADISLSQASGHLRISVGDAHDLQIGADTRRETLEQVKDGRSELSHSGEFSRESYELWLQDTWMPSERWELVAGIRGQEDSDFGEHFAPNLNVRLDLVDNDTLGLYARGGIGSGYRVPNLKERHYRFDHSQLGYVVEGSPDLEPETSLGYQLGFGIHHRKTLWFEANGFLNEIDDLIQTGLDPDATAMRSDNVSVYRYHNVSEARTWGLDTTAGVRPSTHWHLTAGYTYTRTEDVESGNELNRRPRHQAKLALDGSGGLPGLSWSIRARYQSDESVDAGLGTESPSFTATDIKLNYQATGSLALFAGVDNVTAAQRDFADPDDFRPVAGRFIYTGLAIEFGTR